MSRKTRKPYTVEEKVAILRRHLLDHVPVSDLCDEYHLHPTQFYRRQRQFFENGTAALANSPTAALETQIAALEAKLARKRLMEERINGVDSITINGVQSQSTINGNQWGINGVRLVSMGLSMGLSMGSDSTESEGEC